MLEFFFIRVQCKIMKLNYWLGDFSLNQMCRPIARASQTPLNLHYLEIIIRTFMRPLKGSRNLQKGAFCIACSHWDLANGRIFDNLFLISVGRLHCLGECFSNIKISQFCIISILWFCIPFQHLYLSGAACN